MAKLVFILPDGTRREVEATAGKTVLEVAWENKLDVEGACEGSMACSTCHVILSEADYDRLPEPSEDEEDMLDLAWGVCATSRLGCQIVVSDALDGIELQLPAETVNHYGEG